MPTVLHFNIFICKCGELFKTYDGFKKHQKGSDGCKLSDAKHIIYDTSKNIKERLDIKTGISDKT